MAKYTVQQLENSAKALNEQMLKHGESHKDYKKWESSRNYYVSKLTQMDEYNLQTIEI